MAQNRMGKKGLKNPSAGAMILISDQPLLLFMKERWWMVVSMCFKSMAMCGLNQKQNKTSHVSVAVEAVYILKCCPF